MFWFLTFMCIIAVAVFGYLVYRTGWKEAITAGGVLFAAVGAAFANFFGVF